MEAFQVLHTTTTQLEILPLLGKFEVSVIAVSDGTLIRMVLKVHTVGKLCEALHTHIHIWLRFAINILCIVLRYSNVASGTCLTLTSILIDMIAEGTQSLTSLSSVNTYVSQHPIGALDACIMTFYFDILWVVNVQQFTAFLVNGGAVGRKCKFNGASYSPVRIHTFRIICGFCLTNFSKLAMQNGT